MFSQYCEYTPFMYVERLLCSPLWGEALTVLTVTFYPETVFVCRRKTAEQCECTPQVFIEQPDKTLCKLCKTMALL